MTNLKKSSLKVFIIIINYNNAKDTIECIKSIRRQNYSNYEIVVVDNASEDDSVLKIKENDKSVIIIKSSKNLGFSGGNNIGIKYALSHDAEAIMFLNNDTIVENDCLRKMILKLTYNKVICPRIMFWDDKTLIWYAGGKLDKVSGHCISFGYRKKLASKYMKEGETNAITGCCLLMTRETFLDIGQWSEEFFLYREDDDYTLRILQKGIHILYVPEAVIFHKESRSTKKKGIHILQYYFTRNTFYLIKKYKLGIIPYMRLLNITIIKYFLNINNEKNYYLEAFKDYRGNRMGKKFD
ncbi:MAG: glycosyltransferase family 2 protein [Lachnospiraceae bacterium]|nr:glycosyltransferase family 2 protein [Lachnospiraceae bacterium]